MRSSTILGLGAYVPEEIRTNDFWPESLVAQWQQKGKKNIANLQETREEAPSSLHPALAAELEKVKHDPFGGMRERRVAPPEMLPSEMELFACRQALERARVKPEEIELVLSFSLPPDTILVPNTFKIHHVLGLKNARAVAINTICHSFSTMMDIAHQYLANGSIRRCLIVSSTKYSDIQDYSSTVSVAAGDGAVAAVLGDCPAGHGIVFSKHCSDTVFHDSMLIVRRPPNRPRVPDYAYGERQSVERMFFTINRPEMARQAVAAVPVWGERMRREIEAGGFDVKDISLMIPNAAFTWYAPVLANVFDLPLERVEDNVLAYSNMGAVNLPMNLHAAVDKGRIKEGDLVLLIGHGGGLSYGAILLKWWQPRE